MRASASSSCCSPALLGDRLGEGLEEGLVLGEAQDARALAALDQHLDRAVGQLQELQHRADGADGVDVVGRGIVLGGVLLGDQQDLLVVLHHVFERAHRLLAADEQRHDHVREHDDVAQRQDRIERTAGSVEHDASFSAEPDRETDPGAATAQRPPLTATFIRWTQRRAVKRKLGGNA